MRPEYSTPRCLGTVLLSKKGVRRWRARRFEPLATRLSQLVVYRLHRDLVHTILADIGLDDLERIVREGTANRAKVGHTDYTSLSELFVQCMRERAKELL